MRFVISDAFQMPHFVGILDHGVGSLLTLNDPRVMTLVRVKVAQKSGKVDPP